MFQQLATQVIRTMAGYLVAWLLALKLAQPVLDLFGVDSATAKERLLTGAVFVIGTAYYFAVAAAEKKWPKLGVLLGVPKQPVYTAAYETTADGAHVVTTVQNFTTDPAAASLTVAAAGYDLADVTVGDPHPVGQEPLGTNVGDPAEPIAPPVPPVA